MHLIKFTREVLFMADYKKDNNQVDDINTNENKEIPNVTNNHLNDQTGVIPDHRRDEEAAAEITGFNDEIVDREDEVDTGNQIGNIPGWIGLALAVLSFFMMPIIFGAAAIIIGFVARGRDATWLGNTSIALGVISIVVRLLLIPFA